MADSVSARSGTLGLDRDLGATNGHSVDLTLSPPDLPAVSPVSPVRRGQSLVVITDAVSLALAFAVGSLARQPLGRREGPGPSPASSMSCLTSPCTSWLWPLMACTGGTAGAYGQARSWISAPRPRVGPGCHIDVGGFGLCSSPRRGPEDRLGRGSVHDSSCCSPGPNGPRSGIAGFEGPRRSEVARRDRGLRDSGDVTSKADGTLSRHKIARFRRR